MTFGLVIERTKLAAVFLSLLTFAAMAQASHLARKSTDAAEIVALAQRQGHVRVIVQFASPVPPEQIRPDPASIADLRAKIAAVQDAIIAAHFGSASNPRPGQGFERGLMRFDTTPGFAISATLPELEALAADPRATHIGLDRAVPPAPAQRAR
jgi:hypothetical protein